MRYQYSTAKKTSSTGKLITVFLLVCVVSAIVIALTLFQSSQSAKTTKQTMYNAYISTVAVEPIKPSPIPTSQKINMDELKSKIQTIINENIPEGKKWIYGVVVTDLSTQDTLGINENEVFDAASVGKIPILLTIYNEIKNGQIKESDEITIASKDIQDYGTGVLRYQKTPMTLTVKELAELMIKKSDNTAAYVLATKAGRSNIKQFVADIGMNNTDTAENTTTPQDADISLRYLYNLKNSDPVNAGIMTKMMTDSDFEKRLPGQIPEEVLIAHKIGTGVAQIHDVGIVLLDKRPYVISVLSKGVSDEAKAEENIAKISKATYDYFEQFNK